MAFGKLERLVILPRMLWNLSFVEGGWKFESRTGEDRKDGGMLADGAFAKIGARAYVKYLIGVWRQQP